MACLPPVDWDVKDEEEEELERGRADLRHLTVCSIDPEGCKDIDDALHARVCVFLRILLFLFLSLSFYFFLFLYVATKTWCDRGRRPYSRRFPLRQVRRSHRLGSG